MTTTDFTIHPPAVHLHPRGGIVKFTLTFDMTSAAFGDDPLVEAARVLRDVEHRVSDGAVAGQVRDHNGNTIGEFVIAPHERPRP